MSRSTRTPRTPREVALFLASFLIGLTLLTLVVIGPTRDSRVAGWVLLMVGCLYPIIRTPSFRDPYVLISTILSFGVIGIIAFHENEVARAWLAAAIVFVSAAQNRVRNWRELSALTREAEKRILSELEQKVSPDRRAPGGP